MTLALQFLAIVLLHFLVIGTHVIQAQNVTTPRPSLPSGCSKSCLLVSVGNAIITVNPETSRTTTLISGLSRAVGLDVDTVKGYIYWSDVSERVIKRANIDGSNAIVLFRNKIGVCDGLAIDERAGRLYWTDTTHDAVEVADVYSVQRQRRVLFNVSLDKPRGIALELDEGYLFWTDWGRTAKIERSTLSGGSRTTIVSGELVWPNGIAIDYNSRMLVWADANLDKIETSDYNGNNRRVLYQQAGIHPFGLVVKRPFVYWTDWRRGLQRLDLSNNGTVTSYRLPGGSLYGVSLLTIPTKNESRKYVCTFDNGMCGMTHNISGDFNWVRNSGRTSSDGTGPSRDHTTGSGYYMYTEATSESQGATALLLSPVLYTNSSTSISGCVQFWFHMWGVNMGTLRIKVNGQLLWKRSGNQGNRWIPAAVPFRAIVSYQVEFEGVIGRSFESDIAIDDVVITTGTGNCNLPGTPAPPTTRRRHTTATTTTTPTSPSATPPSLQVSRVRLVNGGNKREGRIEVLVRGRWGTVCDDSFDIRDAHVFCRMLGFPSAQRIAKYGPGNGKIWLDDLNCRGNETSINQCPHSGIGSHDCGHSEDIGVVCTARTNATTPPPPVSRVRLVNGRNSREGRIEVLVRGIWGTVCDDGFDIRDAHVFCRMLGFSPAQRIAKYGPGTGQIWLDELNCRGNETSINQCSHRGIGSHDCGHSEDTGVVCTSRVITTRPPPTTRPATVPTRPPGVSPMATHCNFDHSNCGLFNMKGDDFDWMLRSGATPSIATGPSHDVTGHGRYYYMEATGRGKDQRARIQSHPFRLYYKACLTFFYHMYGSDMGTLKVLLNGQLVWQLDGNQGDQWHIANIPIIHTGLKKLTIEGILGKSFRSDIAIDEISLVEHESMGPTNCVFAPNCAKPNQAPPTPTGPAPGSCGYSPRAPNSALENFRRVIGHVIGGNNARPGAWPWQIALYRGGFGCGGSLIKANWVLTAAHCVRDRNPSIYRVVLGDHDRNRNEGTEQSISVIRIIAHPNYNSVNLNNDVALIQLSRPATLNSRVGVICLPRQNVQVAVGHQCYITGWGKIRHPGGSHQILQQALLPVVNSTVCQRKVKASPGGNRLNITPQMVCGGEEGSAKSGCHGDSGGPFVCRRRDGSWVLEGAVSWGSPRCSTRERFSVFARISQFRSWIDGHIGSSR